MPSKLYETTVGREDLELGQDYFGSVVEGVKEEVTEGEIRYKIRRLVTLANGVILVEEVIRDKSLGNRENREYSVPPKGPGYEQKKDKRKHRAKARAILKNNGVEPESINVNVITSDARAFILKLWPIETIKEVKMVIEEKIGLAMDYQRLFFQENLLSDDKAYVGDSNINDGDTLILEANKLHVIRFDEIQFTLSFLPDYTIEDLKDIIEEEHNIRKDEQSLLYKGRILSKNAKSLGDYGVKHNDKIKLEPMRVFINTSNGKNFRLDVEKIDTIDDVRKRVKDNFGISMSCHRATFEDIVLDNTQTLEHYRINNGDTLLFEAAEMNIHVVKQWDGSSATIRVEPSDTIESVKKKLVSDAKLAVSDQLLLFEDEELDDKKTLEDCNIKNDGTLILGMRMKMYVAHWSGRTITLPLKPEFTLNSVKVIVEGKFSIPKHYIRLLWNEQFLDEEDKALVAYGIEHNATLQLEQMKIYVKDLCDTTIALLVDHNDTIEDVKRKVDAEVNVPVSDQRLMKICISNISDQNLKSVSSVAGKKKKKTKKKQEKAKKKEKKVGEEEEDKEGKGKKKRDKSAKRSKSSKLQEEPSGICGEDLDNEKTLKDYTIKHGDTLILEIGMKVHVVHWSGKIVTHHAEPGFTLDFVKDTVEKKMSIQKNHQRLLFNGNLLQENSKSLERYGLKHNDTIHLEPWKLSVKSFEGQKMDFVVAPTDTIVSVKKKVEGESSTAVHDQRLYFADEELNDGSTLEECNIEHGSILFLQPTQIHVSHWDDGDVTLIVRLSDSIISIKERIQQEKNLVLHEQRLLFNGELLEDNEKLLRDCGIRNDARLTLEPIKINVQTIDGESLSLQVTFENTIEEIRNRIKEEADISVPEYQRILFDGKDLEDEITLAESNVKHGDTLIIDPFEIVIKYMDGKEVTLVVTPDTTIGNVKSQILDIPRNYQKLIFDGMHVKDDKWTIEDYKIPNKGALILEAINIGKLWDSRVAWMSNKAIVFPKANAPESQRDDPESRGVWMSKKKLPNDWKPQKVDIFPNTIKFDVDIPHGVWGVNPEAKPNEKGEYVPKDLWFYPPGEMPAIMECAPCGKWSYRERHASKPWPPPKKEMRVINKLPPIWKEHVPPKAIIYPYRQAPKKLGVKDTAGVARGVWKWPKGGDTEDGSNGWVPSDVKMYEDGDEPEGWNEGQPCGVWGVNPEAKSGESNPTDLWFYPPGATPNDDFEPVGRWILPKKSTWPPKSIGQIEHPTFEFNKKAVKKPQREVKKVNLPAFLQGK
jgi:hypothetical protein